MSTYGAVVGPLPKAACSPTRELLSLREVITLADVSEKRVRKDIETGILAEPRIVRLPDARLCFAWHHVFVVAAVYGNTLLNGRMRKVAVERIDDMVHANVIFNLWHEPTRHMAACCNGGEYRKILELDKYVILDLNKVCHNVRPRVGVYATGLERIEEREGILGGEAVFKGTRLSVSHIGKMVTDGETIANIVEDFPQLNEDDVRFAELYYRAHPTIGRPRLRGDCDDVMSRS